MAHLPPLHPTTARCATPTISWYKRIIVGAGHLAKELAGYEQTGEEDVVYLDEEPTGVVKKRCYRPPVLLKGRSYMYGLEDGELPMPAGRCP